MRQLIQCPLVPIMIGISQFGRSTTQYHVTYKLLRLFLIIKPMITMAHSDQYNTHPVAPLHDNYYRYQRLMTQVVVLL